MKKIIRKFNIEYEFDWSDGVAISQIREDLDAIEKLGATHIDIEEDDCYISMEGYVNRLETDKEYDDRQKILIERADFTKSFDLRTLNKLRLKYPNE